MEKLKEDVKKKDEMVKVLENCRKYLESKVLILSNDVTLLKDKSIETVLYQLASQHALENAENNDKTNTTNNLNSEELKEAPYECGVCELDCKNKTGLDPGT